MYQPYYQNSQNQQVPPTYQNEGQPQNYQPNYQQNIQQNYGQFPTFQSQGQPPVNKKTNEGLPSVILRVEEEKTFNSTYESSKTREKPPFPTCNYSVVDKGCASPRFVRSTHHVFPSSTDVAKKLSVPIGLIVQPFARLISSEEPLPVMDKSEDGVMKCMRCRSYPSPFISFHNGGCKYLCPLCENINDVPPKDVSPLDYMGLPSNISERFDLKCGSYEYIVDPTICQEGRVARPPVFIFMLDVSYLNVNNGLLEFYCTYLKDYVLSLLPRSTEAHSDIQVAFVTYDTKISIYSYSNVLMRPQMMTIADIKDICLPMEGTHFLMKPHEAGNAIDSILSLIKEEFSKNPVSECILGPVITFGCEFISSLKGCGKLFVFHSTLPSANAPGSLHIRGGMSTGTKKDLLTPQNDYYTTLGALCIKNACSVELFLFPSAFCDIITLSPLCRNTGGKLYKYDAFHVASDGLRFLRDLQINVSAANQAFDCSFTLKTCLEVDEVSSYGNFMEGEWPQLKNAGIMDEFSTIGVELALNTNNMSSSGYVHFQAVTIYTTISGQRRIRVHNIAYATSSVVYSLVDNTDCFALAMLFCKRSIPLTLTKSLEEIETSIVKMIGTCLARFRTDGNYERGSNLILPSSIDILPIFVLGFLKIRCFSKYPFDCDDIAACMAFLSSASVTSILPYFYPSLYSLHDDQFASCESLQILMSSGTLKPISCDFRNFSRDQAFLIDSGFRRILWIGDQVSEKWLVDVLGVPSVSQIDSSTLQKLTLQPYENVASRGLNMLCDWLSLGRSNQPKLLLACGSGNDRILTGNVQDYLVESPGLVVGKSYQQFLININQVTNSEN